MSPPSSSEADWPGLLDRLRPPELIFVRPDDPRLGEVIVPWNGDVTTISAGRAVLIGFPQDEGVRRNGGRPGAGEAPGQIRRWLAQMTPGDPRGSADLRLAPP